MNDLPITTLFMLMSVDGKISTGATDERDFDKDLPSVKGVADGLQQYYDLEKQTDTFSLNSGKVMAKVGWNEEKSDIRRLPVNLVIVDNAPHLTAMGVANLLKHSEKLYIVTTNPGHPANGISDDNLEIITYQDKIDFRDLFKKLKAKGADKLTVQSGGDLNATLLRLGLINFVSIVVTPLLVGGKTTPSLIGGESIKELSELRTLKLQEAKTLNNSYLHLKYAVENN